jgi:hypothetical protein
MASLGSKTAGSSSYSTSIRSRASSAVSSADLVPGQEGLVVQRLPVEIGHVLPGDDDPDAR